MILLVLWGAETEIVGVMGSLSKKGKRARNDSKGFSHSRWSASCEGDEGSGGEEEP